MRYFYNEVKNRNFLRLKEMVYGVLEGEKQHGLLSYMNRLMNEFNVSEKALAINLDGARISSNFKICSFHNIGMRLNSQDG